MKKITFIISLFLSVATFAQKDELKALKKIYAKATPSVSDLSEYQANITSLETLATDESDKVYKEFYKANLPLLQIRALGPTATPEQMLKFVSVPMIQSTVTALNNTLAFEKKSGKAIYSDDIKRTLQSAKPLFWQLVIALDTKQNFTDVYKTAYAIYEMDKTDHERLYIAANYAFRAKDYDKALEMFNELNALNYTGEATLYVAKNKATDQEDSYATANERDNFVKLGTHINPRIEKVPSKRGEIYKLISFIYIEKGDIPAAKKAIVDARAANPDDISLLMAEADLYLKTNDFVTYKKLISEATLKNPNDADLFYNLGVIAGKTKDGRAEAEKNYLKAIQINPKYKDAYVNLANLELTDDNDLINKMKNIKGVTAPEMKKYNALKAEFDKIRKAALAYYEKAFEIDKTDVNIKNDLISIYKSLEMNDKAKQLKESK